MLPLGASPRQRWIACPPVQAGYLRMAGESQKLMWIFSQGSAKMGLVPEVSDPSWVPAC